MDEHTAGHVGQLLTHSTPVEGTTSMELSAVEKLVVKVNNRTTRRQCCSSFNIVDALLLDDLLVLGELMPRLLPSMFMFMKGR